MAREIAHHEIEDLIDIVVRYIVDARVLQDQLAVHHEGEDLASRQKEIDVFSLAFVGWGRQEHFLECGDLLAKDFEIGCVPTRIRNVVIVEANLAESLRGALIEQKIIVGGLALLSDFRVVGRGEEVVRHELHDQGDVDVHRPFELRQSTDIHRRLLEERVFFKAFGRDHVPQQVHHILALGSHLHLHHRVVEQVTAIFGRRDPHVVRGAKSKKLHGDQARIPIGEHLLHVREIGHVHVVESAIRGVVNRLVQSMGTHSNRGPAQVVLADVHRV